MKHDIIDRGTGNIVGCISFSDNTSTSVILADLDLLHGLVRGLQDRIHELEQQFTEHLETHC
jgi:hypothetical protein